MVFNLRRKRVLHDAVAHARKAAGKGRDEQMKALSLAYQALDKAAKAGTMKKNTAARRKARLAAFLKRSVK